MEKFSIKLIIILLVLGITIIFMIFGMKKNNTEPVKIAFFGDSITDYGWQNDYGYVKLTVKGLQKKGINAVPIPSGIAGNTTLDLINRMDNDIISKHPDIMILMCGLNDVFKITADVSFYKSNMKKIIEKALKNNIKVVLLTVTTTEKDFYGLNNLAEYYNQALKDLAKEENIQLIDVNSQFKKAIKKSVKNPENSLILTLEGIHLNQKGNKLLSKIIVKEIKI